MSTTYRQGSPVCCNPNVSRLAILLSTIFFLGASLALLFQKPVCPVFTCLLPLERSCPADGVTVYFQFDGGRPIGYCGNLKKTSDCAFSQISYTLENLQICEFVRSSPAGAPFPCPTLPSGETVAYVNTPETGPTCFSAEFTDTSIILTPACGLHPNCLGSPSSSNPNQ